MKTTIKVTDECIKAGVRQNACDCPIALAVRNVMKDDVHFRVGPDYIYISGNPYEDIGLPLDAMLFIRDFDNNKPVLAFEFEVDISEELVK